MARGKKRSRKANRESWAQYHPIELPVAADPIASDWVYYDEVAPVSPINLQKIVDAVQKSVPPAPKTLADLISLVIDEEIFRASKRGDVLIASTWSDPSSFDVREAKKFGTMPPNVAPLSPVSKSAMGMMRRWFSEQNPEQAPALQTFWQEEPVIGWRAWKLN